MEEMAVVNSAVCSVSTFGCMTVLPNSQSKMTPSVPSPCPPTKLLLPKSFLCFPYVTTHPIAQTTVLLYPVPGPVSINSGLWPPSWSPCLHPGPRLKPENLSSNQSHHHLLPQSSLLPLLSFLQLSPTHKPRDTYLLSF